MRIGWWVVSFSILLGSCIANTEVDPGLLAEPQGRYEEIVSQMRQLQSEYPSYVGMFSIGTNDEDTPIYALRISTSPNRMDRNKTGHLVVSTHHGNELAAPEFTMAFTKDVVRSFASPELWRTNLADTEWTIIPVLNITGYNAANRYEHGRDPNRDYPGPCSSAKGGRLGSIRTLMEFIGSRVFAGTVTVHGYVGSLTYPWGVNAANDHTNDHNQYAQITAKAAEENGYRHGTHTEIVYPANGTYEDWTYWKYGIWTLLVELRDGSASDITNTVSAVRTFFDLLDSSPSQNYSFDSYCMRNKPDLRLD